MDLAEAMKYVAGLATQAQSLRPVPVEDPKVARFYDGKQVIEVAKPRAARKHVVRTLADFIAYVQDGVGASSPAVWFDCGRVVGVLDDGGHGLDTVTLTLTASTLFQRLMTIEKSGTFYDQKAFVRLLKIELAGTLDPNVLANRVRSIKFENGTVTRAAVQKQRESLGREIISSVSGEQEIPEEVTLAVPVFSNPGIEFVSAVKCAVEIDPPSGTFRLVPLPDELRHALDLAVEYVGGQLRHAMPEVDVYWGEP